MYIVISRSGSMASSVRSWAMTSLAEASSIWTPRKMMRSSKSLLYGFISLTPYDVRSTKDGSTYLDDGYCVTFGFSLSASGGSAELRTRLPSGGGDRAGRGLLGAADHVVHEAVLLGLLRGVPVVAVGVLEDLLQGLAGVPRRELRERLLHVAHLLGLIPDVGRGAADAAGRLVHQDRGVRHGVALARGTCREQELPHARGHAHGVRGHVVGHELHHVVDRKAGVDRAARGVDVDVDVALRVLGGEQQHLSGDPVRDVVVDLLAEEDDAVPQQPLEQQVPWNHWGVRGSRPGIKLSHVVTCSDHFGCRCNGH